MARHPGVAGAAPLDAAPVELAAAVGEHAALALAVADDTENHDGKCPETTLQAVADAWKNAMDLTVATLSEHA